MVKSTNLKNRLVDSIECLDMTKTNWECSTECYTDADYPYCYTQNHDIRYCVEKVLDLNKRGRPISRVV